MRLLPKSNSCHVIDGKNRSLITLANDTQEQAVARAPSGAVPRWANVEGRDCFIGQVPPHTLPIMKSFRVTCVNP